MYPSWTALVEVVCTRSVCSPVVKAFCVQKTKMGSRNAWLSSSYTDLSKEIILVTTGSTFCRASVDKFVRHREAESLYLAAILMVDGGHVSRPADRVFEEGGLGDDDTLCLSNK